MTSLVKVIVLRDLQLWGRASTFVPNFSYEYFLASIDETPFLFYVFIRGKHKKGLKIFAYKNWYLAKCEHGGS